MSAVETQATVTYAESKRPTVRNLGIAQIVLGALSVILGIAAPFILATAILNKFLPVAATTTSIAGSSYVGIWSSPLTIIAGGLAVCAGSSNSSSGLMTAHMVVGILACIVEFSGFIACSVAAGVITAAFGISSGIILIILALIAIVNFSLLIASSAIVCKITSCCCCGPPPEAQPVVYVVQ